jgi:hypothetical protein
MMAPMGAASTPQEQSFPSAYSSNQFAPGIRGKGVNRRRMNDKVAGSVGGVGVAGVGSAAGIGGVPAGTGKQRAGRLRGRMSTQDENGIMGTADTYVAGEAVAPSSTSSSSSSSSSMIDPNWVPPSDLASSNTAPEFIEPLYDTPEQRSEPATATHDMEIEIVKEPVSEPIVQPIVEPIGQADPIELPVVDIDVRGDKGQDSSTFNSFTVQPELKYLYIGACVVISLLVLGVISCIVCMSRGRRSAEISRKYAHVPQNDASGIEMGSDEVGSTGSWDVDEWSDSGNNSSDNVGDEMAPRTGTKSQPSSMKSVGGEQLSTPAKETSRPTSTPPPASLAPPASSSSALGSRRKKESSSVNNDVDLFASIGITAQPKFQSPMSNGARNVSTNSFSSFGKQSRVSSIDAMADDTGGSWGDDDGLEDLET